MYGSFKIYNLDIEEYSAEEIVEKVGVRKMKMIQLLESIREGYEEAIYAFEHEDYKRYWDAGLTYSPNAYELYKRLEEHQPKETTKVIEERVVETGCASSDIRFWIDPVMIIVLFNSLKTDGYYEQKTNAVKTSAWRC